MTDYYPLPGDSVSIPNSSTPSTVPLDGGTASGGIVKLTAGEWEKRAQVAADGAARLLAAAQALSLVARRNNFGVCDEGEGMHSALGPIIRCWADDLTAQADSLTKLADSCSRAAPSITNVDSSSGQDLHT